MIWRSLLNTRTIISAIILCLEEVDRMRLVTHGRRQLFCLLFNFVHAEMYTPFLFCQVSADVCHAGLPLFPSSITFIYFLKLQCWEMRLSWNTLLLNFNLCVNIAMRISIQALCLLEVHDSVGIEALHSLFKSILWLYSSLLELGRFFSFLILYTVGRTFMTLPYLKSYISFGV
jgi:hypothetical protein